MKKVIALSLLAALVPMMASAKGNHPMAGCGLGYIAFGHQENTKGYQILSATVNDIVSPQTSAVTSGTSGCTEDGLVKLAKQVEVYAAANFDNLRQDMAQGSGEYVNTFVSMLGTSDVAHTSLVKVFQSEYASLFPTAQTTPEQLMQNLSGVLAKYPELLG